MTILTFHQPLGAAGAVRGTRETSAGGRISRCRGTVARWIARFRQRRALYEIAERDDQHLLKDAAARGVVIDDEHPEALQVGVTGARSRLERCLSRDGT